MFLARLIRDVDSPLATLSSIVRGLTSSCRVHGPLDGFLWLEVSLLLC